MLNSMNAVGILVVILVFISIFSPLSRISFLHHFKMLTEDDKVKIRTIRAAAITEMIQLTLLRTLL